MFSAKALTSTIKIDISSCSSAIYTVLVDLARRKGLALSLNWSWSWMVLYLPLSKMPFDTCPCTVNAHS